VSKRAKAAKDGFTAGEAERFTVDGLINAKFSLKGQYWANAEWLFHRDAVKQIAKLKVVKL